jgi:hypothetical protein
MTDSRTIKSKTLRRKRRRINKKILKSSKLTLRHSKKDKIIIKGKRKRNLSLILHRLK